ncbi:hypothetical protein G6M89_09165 [Natronolimnobius sp. AArcel1]|nr:hypothetical protein [Natronolimnobius sp. AArcel1]NGM69173.1 hypothetical protein [Natronolimnobius sp. AArcel1]
MTELITALQSLEFWTGVGLALACEEVARSALRARAKQGLDQGGNEPDD